MLALPRLAAIIYQLITDNVLELGSISLACLSLCPVYMGNLNRWSTQGSSDPSAHALFLPVSWDFKPYTACFHMELLTPHRLCISQAKLTYFASQILFLLLPPSYHWFLLSTYPATRTGTNALSSLAHFPLLSLFLLEASHICPAYFPLRDSLCINQWWSNKLPHYSTHFL